MVAPRSPRNADRHKVQGLGVRWGPNYRTMKHMGTLCAFGAHGSRGEAHGHCVWCGAKRSEAVDPLDDGRGEAVDPLAKRSG